MTVGRVLESVAGRLSSTRVCWFTDNQNVRFCVFQHLVEGTGKVVKMLGPIGRKVGRCQHSSCRASAFPRAPTWRPGLEPWGRLPANPVRGIVREASEGWSNIPGDL